MTHDLGQQPAAIAPTAFSRLLVRVARAQIVYQQNLSSRTGVVLAVRDHFVPVFESLYLLEMPDRAGVIFAPGTGEMGHSVTLSAVEHRSELDVLVPIANDPAEAAIDVRQALRLAQQTRRSVVPLGIACGACLPLLRSAMPAPLARMVVMVDAPFEVPEFPQEVPAAWAETIIRLLQRADGRARDYLATWRRSGGLAR